MKKKETQEKTETEMLCTEMPKGLIKRVKIFCDESKITIQDFVTDAIIEKLALFTKRGEKNHDCRRYQKRDLSNLTFHKDGLKMFELIKIGNHNVIDMSEHRFKAQMISGKYHSVQFFLNGGGLSHLFRLRYNTSNGPYVLVKQDSSVFKELKVGELWDMEFNRSESLMMAKLLKL